MTNKLHDIISTTMQILVIIAGFAMIARGNDSGIIALLGALSGGVKGSLIVDAIRSINK